MLCSSKGNEDNEAQESCQQAELTAACQVQDSDPGSMQTWKSMQVIATPGSQNRNRSTSTDM